jgi:hypothetical protein
MNLACCTIPPLLPAFRGKRALYIFYETCSRKKMPYQAFSSSATVARLNKREISVEWLLGDELRPALRGNVERFLNQD